MAGPWERYAAQPDGPWSRYQAVNAPSVEPAGMGTRFLRGLKDPLDAGAQIVANAVSGLGADGAISAADQWLTEKTGIPFTSTAPALNNAIAQDEKTYQDRRAAAGSDGIDWTRMAGNVIGAAPALAALPAAGGATTTAAASGAVGGALQPVTEGADQNFWGQKAIQGGIGAVAGAGTQKAIGALGGLIAPKVDPNVRLLMDKGVTPTPGQIIGGTAKNVEEKLVSFPLVGDAIRGAYQRGNEQLNRAVYNEVLAPLGKKYMGPVGRDGVDAVKSQITAAYDDVLPKLQFKADQQFGQEVGNILNLAQNLPADKAAQFQRIIDNEVIGKLGPQMSMDGISFKNFEAELGRLVKNYTTSSSADDRLMGDALKSVLQSAKDNLARGNPKYAAELGKVNDAFSRYARLRDAAGRAGAEEGFTPAQFSQAVKNQDASRGKDAFARGQAKMQELSDAGRSVLAQKVPNSGTADRMWLNGIAGAGLGYGATINPLAAAGVLAGAAPYTTIGGRLMASLMARNPGQIAKGARGLLDFASPAVRAGSVSLLTGN